MTIAEVKQINKENGFYFFERDTMRFFGTRICSKLYKNNTFITSDFTSFDRDKRKYCVRVFDPSTGNITTAKDKDGKTTFNKFYFIEDAREFARNYRG